MLSKNDRKRYLERTPKFDDIMCGLNATVKQAGGVLDETKTVIALARRFNDEVVRPYRTTLDRQVQENPDFLAHDFIKTANEWGFFTKWIPRIFGGYGFNLPSFSYFIEEIASECVAMANLIGVHYLGVGMLIASWNSRIAQTVFNEVIEGEKKGSPCLISFALTEPDAGSDAEDTALMDKGRMTCRAAKADGGYVVNGSKIFISNGHLSTWHVLISFSDLARPSENLVLLAVKTGMPGFLFGRIERKMGQKGCPASELVFNDCFVPQSQVCIDPEQSRKLKRTATATTGQILDYVLAASRAGVGAFGAGVARGAYETALDFASKTIVEGALLINHEWAQTMLAQMYKNVAVARLAYVESNHAVSQYGMYKLLQHKFIFYVVKYLPAFLINKWLPPLMASRSMTWILRKIQFDWQTDAEIERTSGWGSLAKFNGADMAVQNCNMALDLMGESGLRQEAVAEKHYRDAKLIQIYEGTNQINRINLFKTMIGNVLAESRVFDR